MYVLLSGVYFVLCSLMLRAIAPRLRSESALGTVLISCAIASVVTVVLIRYRRRLTGFFRIKPSVAESQWVEGGLYATPQKNGTYHILKILKLEDQDVHIRVYSNVFETLPKHVEESSLYMVGIDRKEDEALGMGHAPISRQSFFTWGAIFVQQSSVSPDELEGHQIWLEEGGGYF